MNSNPQNTVGNLDGAIAAIRSGNIPQLLAVLPGLPDVNYGGSVLLLVAVDFQNVEAMKILAEHGAKPSESIMDKAVGSKNFEII